MDIPGKLTPAQYRVTLHVPMQDNEGQDIDPLTIGEIEARILEIYPGLTVSEAYGVWRSGSVTYSDVLKLYMVDVNHENAVHPMREIAAFVREACQQERVYLTVPPISTYLV